MANEITYLGQLQGVSFSLALSMSRSDLPEQPVKVTYNKKSKYKI